MRLLEEPVKLRRILVPVKNLTPQALRPVQFAQLFAATNQGEITLLHICDRTTAPEQNEEFESALRQVLSQTKSPANISIKIASHDDIAQVILQAAPVFDLVVLRSMRRRTVAGLAVSDVTTEVIKELTCSLVMFGEPQGLSDRDDVLS
jgi:nucleotide-binding universal stress UspA family protein